MSEESKGGRPSKLNEQIQEDICRVIEAGNYIETACAYVGLSKSTLYDWLKRGAREKQRVEENPKFKIRKSEAPFVEFSNAVEKALAKAEMEDVERIRKASKDYWQASAWRLERRFPDKWGKKDKQQLEHSGRDGGPIETSHTESIDLSKLSDKELEHLENIISKSSNDETDSAGESE